MTEIEKLQVENERLKERADYLQKQVTTHLLVNNHLKTENDKFRAELSELKGKLQEAETVLTSWKKIAQDFAEDIRKILGVTKQTHGTYQLTEEIQKLYDSHSELEGKFVMITEALKNNEADLCKMIEQFTLSRMEGAAVTLTFVVDKTREALSTTQPDIQRIRDEIRAEAFRDCIEAVSEKRLKIYEGMEWDLIDFDFVVEALQSLLPNKKEVE